jgi:flagellar hook-length control protein FliK
MRVAAQEGVVGTPHDVSATRSSGSSGGGGFFALLALLQSGSEGASATTGSDTTGALDGDDTTADGDAGEQGDDAALASAGVVVTLSAAAPPSSPDAPAAAGGATAGGSAPGAAGSAAASGIPLPGAGASAAAARTASATAAAPDTAITGTPTTAVAAEAASVATVNASGPGRATAADKTVSQIAAGSGRGVSSTAAVRTPRTAANDAGEANVSRGQQGTRASADAQQPTATASSVTSTDADGAPAGAPEVARVIGQATEHGATPHVDARPRRRAEDGDSDGDQSARDEVSTADESGFAPGRPTSAPTTTRQLPSGARLVAEPLHALGQAHGRHGDGASSLSDGFGVARSDASAATTAGDGTSRLRATGFTSGNATLPSWVERLASPDGLAATRRGTLHLDLEPNGLGRIELRLSFGRDGVRATVLTEHEHTRSLLASQQPQLAAALERNDLRLESFLVDVGTQSGGDGREAFRDATDPAAFDQIGMVHVSAPDATSDTLTLPTVAARGLVNVRA